METVTVVARYGDRTETFTLWFDEYGARHCFVAGHPLMLERDSAGVLLLGTGFERHLRHEVPEAFEYIGVPVKAVLQVR